MSEEVLAKDKIGGCRYVVTLRGSTLIVEMRGYGLKATDSQRTRRTKGKFNYDAAKLGDKMVVLERRMRALARLTTQLKVNHVTGIPTMNERRPARGRNPLDHTKV